MPFFSKVRTYLSLLKSDVKLMFFACLMSVANFLFFHIPFFSFVFQNVDYHSLNGIVIIVSLIIVMLVANFFVFYLLLFLLAKWLEKCIP